MAETDKKKRVGPFTFFREVQSEARKISWTTLSETQQATIFVLIMCVLAAIFLFSADQVIKWLFTALGVIVPADKP